LLLAWLAHRSGKKELISSNGALAEKNTKNSFYTKTTTQMHGALAALIAVVGSYRCCRLVWLLSARIAVVGASRGCLLGELDAAGHADAI
jgi:hypothetical protein